MQDRGFNLFDPQGFATPRLRHPRDDVVASDTGELLGEDLGLSIGQVGVFGNNSCLWYYNPGTSVLKVSIDADIITWKQRRGDKTLVANVTTTAGLLCDLISK